MASRISPVHGTTIRVHGRSLHDNPRTHPVNVVTMESRAHASHHSGLIPVSGGVHQWVLLQKWHALCVVSHLVQRGVLWPGAHFSVGSLSAA